MFEKNFHVYQSAHRRKNQRVSTLHFEDDVNCHSVMFKASLLYVWNGMNYVSMLLQDSLPISFSLLDIFHLLITTLSYSSLNIPLIGLSSKGNNSGIWRLGNKFILELFGTSCLSFTPDSNKCSEPVVRQTSSTATKRKKHTRQAVVFSPECCCSYNVPYKKTCFWEVKETLVIAILI